ncbi:MAG: nickel pincer cofactor biosynthesis protein LarC [Nocardioides sp.]|uniref:nickel pincer cofactor biosynthesis protein LarC n=1 Tax=Nocardioides sp. TaxID=35761 RepID=UPI0039E59305
MTSPTTGPTTGPHAGGTVWVDAAGGASGDMLLGALLDLGVPLEVIAAAVDAVAPEPVTLRPERVRRAGFAATGCRVRIADSRHHRSWREIRGLLGAAELSEPVRRLAIACFTRLAEAEAAVHGVDADEIGFHEVGALDAIADVVGVCAGFAWLAPARVVVSPVAVGSGSVAGAHGVMPVPPPAVARLLLGFASYAGPAGAPSMELCTPTGAALLTTLATGTGPQPAMTATGIGVGAGSRDPDGHANVLRLIAGTTAEVATPPTTSTTAATDTTDELVLEANLDDLDPRLLPGVIDALLAAGAADAWLTPLVMKKGRPAHTLHALVSSTAAEACRRVFFTQTSTIGLREHRVTKHALPRTTTTVTITAPDGTEHEIGVKLAYLDGRLVNAQPEWDDVARVAAAIGRPAYEVLAEAAAAARQR